MKKERNLLKLLSDAECLEAYKESLINANNHRQSAEAIAKNDIYGIAVSHLVLSTEEFVKALLLYIQHFSIDVRNVPGIHLFFTDHIIKHRLATYMNMMYPMSKIFMGLIFKVREKLHNPESNIVYTSDEEAIMSKEEGRIKDINVFKNLPEMLHWWDEANVRKNKGFYIDYTTSLETPMQVTEKEYTQALAVTLNFKNQVEDIISYCEKATKEDRIQIARDSKKYKIKEILLPIIESRKEEMKKR